MNSVNIFRDILAVGAAFGAFIVAIEAARTSKNSKWQLVFNALKWSMFISFVFWILSGKMHPSLLFHFYVVLWFFIPSIAGYIYYFYKRQKQ